MCVCVCVCMRDSEGAREKKEETKRGRCEEKDQGALLQPCETTIGLTGLASHALKAAARSAKRREGEDWGRGDRMGAGGWTHVLSFALFSVSFFLSLPLSLSPSICSDYPLR